MSWRHVVGDGLFSLTHSPGSFLSLFILNILSPSNLDFSSDIQNWTSNSDIFSRICNTHLKPNMSQTQHLIIAKKPPPFMKSIILGNDVKPWSLIWAKCNSCLTHQQFPNISSSHHLHYCHLSQSYQYFHLNYCNNLLSAFCLFCFVLIFTSPLVYPIVSN